MNCQVGPANADIAGLGIIISFPFQAGLSLSLSFYSLSLWRSAIISLDQLSHHVFSNGSDALAARTTNREEKPWDIVLGIFDIYREFFGLFDSSEIASTDLDQRQADEDTTQFPTTLIGRLMWRGGENHLLKKKCIDKILATIGDVQVINAMGLLIAALIQSETLSLYHLRVVYDTASFTAISACASLINVFADADSLKMTRFLALLTYSSSFMSFSIVFGTKLSTWNEKLPGRCYNTRLIATPDGTHPLNDMIYLGVTCSWSLIALSCCYMSGLDVHGFMDSPNPRCDLSQVTTHISDVSLNVVRFTSPFRGDRPRAFRWNPIIIIYHCFSLFLYLSCHPKAEYRVWVLMPLAMAQYPLHLYMAIAIRKGNERFLEGDSENYWGFGQIVPLVLCVATCIECIRGYSEYRKAVRAEPVQPQGTRARRRSL